MLRSKVFPSLLTAVTLAIGLSAMAPALAADNFPTGTFASDGIKVTLTFSDKGKIQVNSGEEMEVEADYTITGDQIRLTDTRGPEACTAPSEQSGTYHWKYDNGALTFTTIADECGPRRDDITTHTWRLQK